MSFIWVERFPTLLLPKPARAPMAYLGSEASYSEVFTKALEAANKAEESEQKLQPPWLASEGRYLYYFWYYYLEQQVPDEISGKKAWRFIVPLRDAGFAKISSVFTGKPSRRGEQGKPDPFVDHAVLEAFYYPHCFGVVSTVFVEPDGDLSFSRVVDKLIELRRRGRYQIRLPKGSTKPPASLNATALLLLQLLREKVLGKGVEQGRLLLEPLSIVSFIQGESGRHNARAMSDEVHRALDGLCNWNRNWENTQPRELTACSLKVQDSPKGHILYQHQRGRAVWFPNSFLDQKASSLGCYHRNLTLLSLQTESLLSLVRVAAEYLDIAGRLPLQMRELARYGCDLLEKLYQGKEDTYRSCSAYAQISCGNNLDYVNKIRRFLAKAPLERDDQRCKA